MKTLGKRKILAFFFLFLLSPKSPARIIPRAQDVLGVLSAGVLFSQTSFSRFGRFACLVLFIHQPCLHIKARSLSLLFVPLIPSPHTLYIKGVVLPVIMSSGTQYWLITKKGIEWPPDLLMPNLHSGEMFCTIRALLGPLYLLLPSSLSLGLSLKVQPSHFQLCLGPCQHSGSGSSLLLDLWPLYSDLVNIMKRSSGPCTVP